METTAQPVAPVAGPSAESSAPSAYDEDTSRHLATTASQVPIPTGNAALSALPPLPPSPETMVKDCKSHGTRFHEECQESDLPSPRLRSTRMFKGKGKEGINIEPKRKRPLNLLDLPLDILKEIVKEVTHTNDLTSLALCHSALHRLTTPHIYSRFDIVWPDTNAHAEPRSGVDALTYGLATLVMAEEIFGEAPEQKQALGNRFNIGTHGRAPDMMIRRRRGNHYAQFTRKFSLGNGPADWVQEYLITKEGGKMLGTLVALAVARMRALETFVWDMPTGILRDVWLALSSLGDRFDGRPCRLEKVWVRWHDNSSVDIPPASMATQSTHLAFQQMHTQTSPTSAVPSQPHPSSLDRVEHPSFSVLPPLKSLSVLDIDELAYLDEMAVLIGRSLDKLRELRVGIARHAAGRAWTVIEENDQLQQIDPNFPTASSLTIGEKRLGGVLGTLTGFVSDIRRPTAIADRARRSSARPLLSPSKSPARSTPALFQVEPLMEQSNGISSISNLRNALPAVSVDDGVADLPASPSSSRSLLGSESAFENDPLIVQSSHHPSPLRTPNSEPQEPIEESLADDVADQSLPEPRLGSEDHIPDKQMQLDSLELERIPLSVPVLQKAIDWSKLSSLTLLHCQNHEQLWKTLRRTFPPVPRSPTYPPPGRSTQSSPRKIGKSSYAGSEIKLEYGLRIKKIHTNAVSPALISFLKDTIAPNSLEVLFLQDSRSYTSPVTVDQIFKGPLRRHRNSLRKLLIDSSEKGSDGSPTNSSRWRKWMLSREVLSFICNGKMPALRELGMVIDYREWHFFLQHLPSISQLRSLSIPFLGDHVHGADVDPRELALQIVDIVALRPEVELCYMGICNKCFEILENRKSSDAGEARPESHLGMNGGALEEDDGTPPTSDVGSEEDEAEEAVENADGGVEENGGAGMETESDEDDDEDDDTDSEAGSSVSGRGRRTRLRLREILFYDDKVAIFKARHGRL